MKLKYYIYVYYDPRDRTPRYVGEGCGNRSHVHLNNADNTELRKAIAEWRALGLEPIIEIEERRYATKAEVWVREKELIAHYGRLIWCEGPLFNITEGGDGLDEETARCNAIRLHSDPKFRDSYEAGMSRREADIGYKKRRAEGISRCQADPGYQERRNEGARKSITLKNATPEHQELVRRGNATPEHLDHLRRQRADPLFQKRRAEGIQRYHERKRREKALALSLAVV